MLFRTFKKVILFEGLEKLSKITKDGHWELQVDLEDFEGNTGYARYG